MSLSTGTQRTVKAIGARGKQCVAGDHKNEKNMVNVYDYQYYQSMIAFIK